MKTIGDSAFKTFAGFIQQGDLYALDGSRELETTRRRCATNPVRIRALMHSVLVYHSISSPIEPLEADADISPERFESQLRWLSRWRRVVPLEETLRTKAHRNVVAITFDDGYRDNLTVALPLLEKFQLPMTLFVTAGFIGREGYLSENELREISNHPLVTIGAHGLWHRHFNRLPSADAHFELIESRRLLAGITGTAVDLLAWPYGECNEALEQLSDECGYRASWSVWKGTNNTHSRWRVPLGRRDNLTRFVVKSSGFYALTKAKWHRRHGMNDYFECAGTGRGLDHDGHQIENGVALRLPPQSRIFDQ